MEFFKRLDENSKLKGTLSRNILGCIMTDNYDDLEETLRRRIEINDPDIYKSYPLHFAARSNKMRITQLLLSLGADVNLVDMQGDTPLLRCIDIGGGYKRESDESIHTMAQTLLMWGADINARDIRGKTPLIKSVDLGMFELCRYLIARGADTEIRDMDGHTALAYSQHEKMFKILIDGGADYDVPLLIGMGTILGDAVDFRKYTKLKILVQRGLDVNKQYGSNKKSVAEIVKEDIVRLTQSPLIGIWRLLETR